MPKCNQELQDTTYVFQPDILGSNNHFSSLGLHLVDLQNLINNSKFTMPSRLNLIGATRSLAVRSRPSVIPRQQLSRRVASQRAFADEKGPKATPESDPNVIGHVSEEAVDMGNVTGEAKPDLNQGTPVQEVRGRSSLDGELIKKRSRY
jgi:hypothetical protein